MYGDFASAAELARGDGLDVYLSTFNARQQTFSQLISSLADNQATKTSYTDFARLLEALRRQGDVEATAFRDLEAAARPVPMSAIVDDLVAASSAFEVQLARDGPSQGMVASSRALSRAYAASGQSNKALAYELVALNGQNELAKASSVDYGPLPYRLIVACQLTRSSRRALDLGFGEVSTVLAKEAVNRLQEVRVALIGLPLQLRNCFSELAQDQYRQLIALFIDQRLVEQAKAVNNMLRDVEKYEYASLDPSYVHKAFNTLPIFDVEQNVLERAFAVKPTGSAIADRFTWLKARRAAKTATATELVEFGTLEQELKRRHSTLDSAVNELLEAVSTLSSRSRQSSVAAQISNQIDNSADQRTLIQEIEEGKAASLLFFVLNNRMDAVLTTKSGSFLYSWKEIGNVPFSESALNQKINALRAAIDDRSSGSVTIGEELYNLLFEQSSFGAELRTAGVQFLYLSPDRNLRNLPFAALKSTRGYLATQFVLILSTGISGRVLDYSRPTSVAGFGMTNGVDGFPPLVNAGAELSAIVKRDEVAGAAGVFAGTVKLNQDFTLATLQDAFVRLPGDPANRIVHIASHFRLADTDATSFLLLGDGKHLTIDEIRKNAAVYDFRDVDLLTLSACSTAYSPSANAEQSQAIQSFAALAQQRGARAILATLWPVVDSSTARFMETFYRLKAKGGVSNAVALAMAQREFISSNARSLSDPFFWSGFVVLTNSR